MTAPLLITPHRAPEILFGLGPVAADGEGARASMRTAPWMTDPDGAPSAGMLGVLLDDVVGQTCLTARPDDHWPVTTELSIDVVGDLPADGTTLSARSRLLSAGDRAGSARGEVRDAAGTVLAVATLTTRYIRGVPALGSTAHHPEPPPAAARMHEVFGAVIGGRPGVDARLTVPPGRAVANVAGHGHGGVLAALCAITAAAAVTDDEHPVRTVGLRLAYLRPAVLDGPLRLDAQVVHRGRTSALTRVDVVGGDGNLCTAATVTSGPRGDHH